MFIPCKTHCNRVDPDRSFLIGHHNRISGLTQTVNLSLVEIAIRGGGQDLCQCGHVVGGTVHEDRQGPSTLIQHCINVIQMVCACCGAAACIRYKRRSINPRLLIYSCQFAARIRHINYACSSKKHLSFWKLSGSQCCVNAGTASEHWHSTGPTSGVNWIPTASIHRHYQRTPARSMVNYPGARWEHNCFIWQRTNRLMSILGGAISFSMY